MKRRALLLGIAGIVATPAQPARARQRDASKSPMDQVAEAERAFADTMARRDLDAFASHLSEEAIFIGNEGKSVLRGKARVVEGWKKFFAGPTAPFSWTPDLVEVLESGSLAMSSGPVRDAKGTIVGRFNSIWRLEHDGRWRVVFDRGCPVCQK